MFCIRQSEQLQADGQVADPETQSSASDCQANQTGTETDHNVCTDNSWYEDFHLIFYRCPQNLYFVLANKTGGSENLSKQTSCLVV